MTLPFSDKPEKSRVYNDLKTLDLDELTGDQFDALRASMKSEGVNGLEDEYRRLVLLQMAGNIFPTGAPFGRLQILQADLTAAGTEELFTPGPGEVWMITNVLQLSTYTGFSFGIIRVKDNENGKVINIVDSTTTGTRIIGINEPQYFGYGNELQATAGGTATGGTTSYLVSIMRIR